MRNPQITGRALGNFASVTNLKALECFCDKRTAYWEPRAPCSWGLGPPMPEGRVCSSCAVVGNRLHVVGGMNAPICLCFDRSTAMWSRTPPLPHLEGRTKYHMLEHLGGKVLAVRTSNWIFPPPEDGPHAVALVDGEWIPATSISVIPNDIVTRGNLLYRARVEVRLRDGALSYRERGPCGPGDAVLSSLRSKRPGLSGRPPCKGVVAMGVARRVARLSGERTLRVPPF